MSKKKEKDPTLEELQARQQSFEAATKQAISILNDQLKSLRLLVYETLGTTPGNK